MRGKGNELSEWEGKWFGFSGFLCSLGLLRLDSAGCLLGALCEVATDEELAEEEQIGAIHGHSSSKHPCRLIREASALQLVDGQQKERVTYGEPAMYQR